MSKLKYFFLHQFEKVSDTVKRFYLPFCLIIALFFTISCVTLGNFDDISRKALFKLVYTFAFAAFTCTIAKVFHENHFANKLSRSIINIAALIISAIPYVLLTIYEDNFPVILGLAGIVITEIILILYFSKNESMSETFSHYFKSILFNLLACCITFGGISICILAFTNLIFDFKDSYKAYMVLGEFVGIVLFGTMFLVAIPKVDQKITIPQVFKIIVSKVMLPIYVLLLAILYIYLGKILFTWTFPSGQVNWFVSFSSLIFTFFAFSLNQYKNENKAINLFLKFSGIAIIPTIVMQFVAIYIRISNYGLTTSRYASIILNIFALIFAIMFLFRREKSLKPVLSILAGIVILTTATPLNIIDIPMREQSYKLKTLLTNNNMLVDNIIISNSNIDTTEKGKIIESYHYVKNNFKNASYKPDFLNENIINKSEKEIFDFEKTYQRGEGVYNPSISFSHHYDFIDVAGYSKVYELTNYNALVAENNEVVLKNPIEKRQIIKGLYNYLKDMYLKHKKLNETSVETEKIEYEFENSKLILSHITLYQDQNEMLGISYHGGCYLLEK